MRMARVTWRRLAEEEPGQAALEMAFAMPLFVAVVFGVIQCSLVLQTYCNATYACRNAGRFAMLHSLTALAPSTVSQVQSMVTSSLFLSSAISPTVTVSYLNPTSLATATNNVGNLVCVKASWSQKMSIPFMTTTSFTVGTQSCKMISR